MDKSTLMEIIKPIASASVIIAVIIKYIIFKHKKNLATDEKLFKQIIADLPSYEDIKFMFREHDYNNTFGQNVYNTIDKIIKYHEDPLCRFRAKNLHNTFINLAKNSKKFRNIANANCDFTPNSLSRYSVSRKKFGAEYDDEKTAKDLNQIANNIFNEYDNFLRHARDLNFIK